MCYFNMYNTDCEVMLLFLQFDLQLVNNVYPVMTKDALLTSHAISTPIIDPDDIPQLFDSISYDKVSNLSNLMPTLHVTSGTMTEILVLNY